MTVANHQHPGNPCFRAFGTGARVGHNNEPVGTMVVSGGATSTPIVGPMRGNDGAYARMLDATLPRIPPPLTGLSLAEFFCCAGGIGLGFRSAGFRIAFANDLSAKAAASYALNLGHRPLVRDIREVTTSDYGPPKTVDVVSGGFPCVTFSTAGNRLGLVDDLNGKLYLELCRVIRELQPRYFVAENVEGILSANGGKAVKVVLAEFLRLGYRTSYELVNMAEHGVPQTRKRVIFVGVRLDQWRGSFRFPMKTHRLRADKTASAMLPIALSLATAIADLPPPDARNENAPRVSNQHEENNAKVSATHAMSKRFARSNAPAPTVVAEAANVQPFIVGGRNPDFHNPLRKASDPGVTMTSGGQAELASSDGRFRRMSVRECARVQSFPDWFRFAGSQADGYRVVGNAVPPLYARRLALAILEYDAREIMR